MKFVCVGNVRGWCGHEHKTHSKALECTGKDERKCRQKDGYSDRKPFEVPGELNDEPDARRGDLRWSDHRGYFIKA